MARNLKVEEIGNFYRHKTFPRIRLQGKWIEKAGIPPESRVEIENPEPGVLIIRSIPQEKVK